MQLAEELAAGYCKQAKAVSDIIKITQPDILLINEFDYDPDKKAIWLFIKHYLNSKTNNLSPINYPYIYTDETNTGLQSGFDLNNDDIIGGSGDAYGYGYHHGHYGMVLLSKFPIISSKIRTFQNFLWKDMPNALLPDDPCTIEPCDWYSYDELEVVRLSSKSHWDIPILVGDTVVHVLASHPTPPVFDGPEGRNGKRNHDEIRFWDDYINPEHGHYIYDDEGATGGLEYGQRFIIMGDLNADPCDGTDTLGAIIKLLQHPLINSNFSPESKGAVQAHIRQKENNLNQKGNPSLDTADFDDKGDNPGNLRVDYVLPSVDLNIVNSGVFWPTKEDGFFDLVGDNEIISSDHRLVYVDITIQ